MIGKRKRKTLGAGDPGAAKRIGSVFIPPSYPSLPVGLQFSSRACVFLSITLFISLSLSHQSSALLLPGFGVYP
ncbi:hypothetical protein Nepgr_023509 [Nepenthes gracilis]|uniref:Uncharacterized protein n=1 Tax=Nepenthes gracilis TaxID=150966 RepID=A0AAD3T2N4_NEPGR|nr:hypothetical protein Nepgr_023509 [Nepenthes gracilis]